MIENNRSKERSTFIFFRAKVRRCRTLVVSILLGRAKKRARFVKIEKSPMSKSDPIGFRFGSYTSFRVDKLISECEVEQTSKEKVIEETKNLSLENLVSLVAKKKICKIELAFFSDSYFFRFRPRR